MREIGAAVPWWIALPALVALGAVAWIVLVALGNALLMVAEIARQRMRELIAMLTGVFADAILATGRIAGKLAVGLLLVAALPLQWIWRHVGMRVMDTIEARLEEIREQRELRRLWRAEFRDAFRTFDEFLAAFHGNGAPRNDEGRPETESPRPPDRFAAACKLFGFSPDTAFTQEELTTRYRKLMQKAHPEHGGSHERAAQLNAARDLIKRRKGWK